MANFIAIVLVAARQLTKMSCSCLFSCKIFRFLKYHQDCNEDVNDQLIQIFRDRERTPLKHVSLRNCTVTNDGMATLLQHELSSLSMWYCDSVNTEIWPTMIQYGRNLRALELGRYVDLLKYSEPNEKTPIDFQLELPNLRKLILNAVVLQPSLQFSHLTQLAYLDLTSCVFAEFTLEALTCLPNLTALILFNVWPLESEIPIICKMKNLTTLDISTASVASALLISGNGSYQNPNQVSYLQWKPVAMHCAYWITILIGFIVLTYRVLL